MYAFQLWVRGGPLHMHASAEDTPKGKKERDSLFRLPPLQPAAEILFCLKLAEGAWPRFVLVGLSSPKRSST